MHLKSTSESTKVMASVKDEDSGSRTSNNINNNSTSSGGGGKGNEDNNSSTTQADNPEIKLKKQTLEQRKLELEKLLGEKNWLLQQIQKQEAQILNGNFEYLNLNEIFANLAQQYKQEQAGGGGGSGSTAILRRKTASKENQQNNNNNNNNSRQSEISNRSSEYDNYPGGGGGGGDAVSIGGLSVAVTTQQPSNKNALKKRATPTPTAAANLNYVQLQRQQAQQQQQQHQHQHQHQQVLQQQTEQQHLLQQQLQFAAQHQQLQQQQKLLQHHSPHYHHQQQLSPQQQRQFLPPQTDAISLYSVNSANVATLRQQHIAPQQQPIVVQCDKYYLSPTHQSYSDGGFIKSSQVIKKYISPLASPTQQQSHVAMAYEQQPLQQHLLPLQQLQQHALHHQRQLDAISLAPSYVSMDGSESVQNLRWRSQSHIPHQTPAAAPPIIAQDTKSHSSDMLAQTPILYAGSSATISSYYAPPPNLKSKPLDEISISSLNSETHKKTKPKQWTESSLDGPVIRTHPAIEAALTPDIAGNSSIPLSARLLQKSHNAARERNKLSSQSMSSGRHYSMSAQKGSAHGVGSISKPLQDDDGRYAKLSQSTSYLNAMDAAPQIELPNFKYLPPKAHAQNTPPPPRPPPAEKANLTATQPASIAALSPPDIRIESPKNMTVVQQATFQPYKEITKPFEMSDFYKYSTKYRQKETSSSTQLDPNAM